jgi:hypothetical protein
LTAGAPAVALYRGQVRTTEGRDRSFRILLHAERPDRLHAELLTPIGTTQLIVDGGGGRLSIAWVRRGVAYVGRASPEAVEAILGVALGLDELVGVLLSGAPVPAGHAVERSPDPVGTLPARLVLRAPDTVVTLELKRSQPLAGEAGKLGRGEPPAGMEVRPIEELDLEAIDAELAGEDDPA